VGHPFWDKTPSFKLWSIERKSHIMSLVSDEGLALFAGLNVSPKKSYFSEYSSPSQSKTTLRLLALRHDQIQGDSLLAGLTTSVYHWMFLL
jgi:hypothetical protein